MTDAARLLNERMCAKINEGRTITADDVAEMLDTIKAYQAELATALEEAVRAVDEAGYYCLPPYDETGNLSLQIDHSIAAIEGLRPDARTALDKLIAEAVEAEREACAALVEEWQAYTLYGRERISGEMAAEIRNRGGEDG